MVIAVTGGIATGKSIVLDYLKNKGYRVVSCDDISHEMFDSHNEEIKEQLSIEKDGYVSRSEISNMVFNDKSKLELLNNILHPLILERMDEEIIKFSNETMFMEVPLLYDMDLTYMFDNVIFIYSTYEKEIERLMDRNNIDKEKAINILKNQLNIEEKLIIAKENKHFVIDNNQEQEYTYKQLDKILGEML